VHDAILVDLLRRVPLFAGLPAVDLDALARASRPLARRKGARVFEEGSPADCCLVLTSGRAKIVLSGTGDSEIIVGILEPFGIVGEFGLIDGEARSAGLVALEECQFVRIPREAFLALRASPAFQQAMLAHVTSMLRKANDHLRAVCAFSAVERVAWSLGRIARDRGAVDGAAIVVRPRPAHQDLADMTGCSRETVTRALDVLKRRKCVTWAGDVLRIEPQAFRRHFHRDIGLADVTEITRLV
jgi:CRP-like cAMP-binding protein